MDLSPYSLNLKKSDDYYKDVEYLTDVVFGEFEKINTTLVPALMLHYSEIDSKPRNFEEYVFEFLMIGTYWGIYGSRAVNLDEKHQLILRNLACLRNENGSHKEVIDTIRGLLMTQYLWPQKPTPSNLEFKMENFDKLLKYLEATGDFTQETARLNFWKQFFNNMNSSEASKHLKQACEFADYFELRSKEILGKYSVNVTKFLEEKLVEHLWREDIIFCSKMEVEYHLNMFGAEIMNRTLKKDFDGRPRKALILPGCMRSNTNCRATDTNLGLKCMKCSKTCNVFELTVMGEQQGFELYMVTHESSAFSKSTQKDRDELGIVGVACVSNLISGGWKSQGLGIPAQCVLLNQATCKNHWNEDGTPTSLNVNQLMKVLGETRNIQL